MPARVFTIPASTPFLPTLIGALQRGELIEGFPNSSDPLALANATLFLPTRRACALAREAFLDAVGDKQAAVLPRIVPLGDIDEDELAFAEAASGEAGLDLLDATQPLERRLLLAQLILRWIASPGMRTGSGQPLVANTPASALALADALARLMDDMTTRKVLWNEFDRLVPPEHDEYWQKTLDFLRIAREYWPAELRDRNKIDPAARRDLLIEAERKRLETHGGFVIAAGSTGSMPATASLLATIAKLPHGAVVLPGLDADLDENSWELIGEIKDGGRVVQPPSFGHPQLAMHGLLRRIRIARDEVVALGTSGPREKLSSEALRPPETTEHWAAHSDLAACDAALAGITVIEAANAEDEALAIAVALREAVHENKTAALVTPDRALARRVAAALMRWNIEADNSGGDRLPDTEAGVFARLVAQAALSGLEPVTLLALLKHARFRLGESGGAHNRAIAALELAVLRGPRPRAGKRGLAHALATFRVARDSLHGSDPRRLIVAGDLDAAEALVRRVEAALAPLQAITDAQSFTVIAALHMDALRALSDDGTNELAFAGDDGIELARAFEAIAEPSAVLRAMPGDYVDLFETAISDRVCGRAGRPGARVQILGTIEARLVHVDRMLLGGLVEGVWPPETRTDPWLSRPMRLELGLDLPERRIGLSAHDFAQLLGMPEVFLTRATKVRGAPTVASRFMQRLAAVAGEAWPEALARGEQYLAWARDLDRAEKITSVKRPRPTPPLAARPGRLSVTEIEHWLRDPYTIYAKHILELRPLDAVDTPPGARDRGTVIHGAIGDFTEKYASGLPADPLGALVGLGEKHFAPLQDYPEARAFWWPRFLRIARWFIAWEAQRRANASALHAEVPGELKIQIDKWTFKLTTRADRIEQLADGLYAILDYKTGSTPTEPQVRTGLSPQLTLEGAILRQGGFKGVAPGSLSEFTYVSLRGREPAGEEKPIAFKEGTADFHADMALARLRGVVERFADVKTPYRSLVSPMWKARYGDYDHLARVAEWSAGGEDEEGEP
ncbi:MAG: double-strand break repair protein AddB [Alphaproteobacteria bacterium]